MKRLASEVIRVTMAPYVSFAFLRSAGTALRFLFHLARSQRTQSHLAFDIDASAQRTQAHLRNAANTARRFARGPVGGAITAGTTVRDRSCSSGRGCSERSGAGRRVAARGGSGAAQLWETPVCGAWPPITHVRHAVIDQSLCRAHNSAPIVETL